ncbi:MAG: hypothetical protein FWG31_05385 [Oscillospiraceae bacterium]|nr:hypothetical protein [Oscillospiraceae bacterium]
MKRTIKRAAVLLLTVAVAVTLSACASFADLVEGFAGAATYMHGETNVRSEMQLSVKLADNAKPVPFGQFISLIDENAHSAAELEDILTETELGISVITEQYGDSLLVSIGWVGSSGVEPLLTLIYDDQALYISTEILGALSQIDSIASEIGMILPLIGNDYIKIDLSTIPGMLDMLPGFAMPEIPQGTQESIQEAADAFAGALREYTPKILTEEFEQILRRDNGGYLLTLNAETTLALLGEIISMAVEYEQELKDFLLNIGGEYGLEAAMLDEVNFRELAEEYEAEAANIVIGEDIPAFHLVYHVAGTGKGSGKKQTSSFRFTTPIDDFDLPFDKLIISGSSVSTIMTKPIAVPANTVTLESLIGKLMLSQMRLF